MTVFSLKKEEFENKLRTTERITKESEEFITYLYRRLYDDEHNEYKMRKSEEEILMVNS